MDFQLRIAHSEVSFPCGAQETILDAAARAGYELPFSCRSGVCGNCEGEILDGAFVEDVRRAELPVRAGPATRVKFCRATPRSDLEILPREVRRLDPDAQKTVVGKVFRIAKPCAEVAVLRIRFPAGTRVKFRAGQYLRIILEDGAERCFSLANPPHENDGAELHIRYLPGGRVGERVFTTIQMGDPIQVRLPFGDFHLCESEKPILLVAGGTGFAPIKSIVEDALRKGVRRSMRLYWGARQPDLLYMTDVVSRWAARHAGFSFIPVVSDPRAADGWRGRTGLVHRAVLEDFPNPAGHEVYACGGPAMITTARQELEAAGLDPRDFHCDAFVPAGS
jgi:CDP-4-dehydro-6-deoxyglucose reductase/3-phenylpropionate/trans-cinnamate dioxygenase ferredoxin reductase subunit